MVVNYRILRSDKDKFDIIKVNHNDRQDAINKLGTYLSALDPDYQSNLPGLSLWVVSDNAPCGYYKNIMHFETPNNIDIIIQVKRIKTKK